MSLSLSFPTDCMTRHNGLQQAQRRHAARACILRATIATVCLFMMLNGRKQITHALALICARSNRHSQTSFGILVHFKVHRTQSLAVTGWRRWHVWAVARMGGRLYPAE
jgi:hypothetical protein